MHPLRKKYAYKVNHAVNDMNQMIPIKEVELSRGRGGYGFTISSEFPCILNSIAPDSSAALVGLKSGDRLVRVNGLDVSNTPHDDVVRLIGSSHGFLVLGVDSGLPPSAGSESDSSSSRSQMPGSAGKPTPGRTRVLRDMQSSSSSSQDLPAHVSGKYMRHISSRKFFVPEPTNDMMSTMNNYRNRPTFDNQSSDRDSFRQRYDSSRELSKHSSTSSHQRSHKSRYGTPQKQTRHTIVTREARMGLQHPIVRTEYDEFAGQRSNRTQEEIFVDGVKPGKENRKSSRQTSILLVVKYSGSVEMPRDPKQANSRLQSIHNAVKRLRSTHNVQELVAMHANVDGISLINCSGKVIIEYRTERVAFAGVCPDDARFFGIVTIQLNDDDMQANPESITSAACHIFMVDPTLSAHPTHVGIAERFGINCTFDVDKHRCTEFPISATPVISCIGQIYRKRRTDIQMAATLHPGPFPHGSYSINSGGNTPSDSSSEADRISERNLKVFESTGKAYIVDAAVKDNDEAMNSDVRINNKENNSLNEASLDESFIHNLSAIQPVSGLDANSLTGDRSVVSNSSAFKEHVDPVHMSNSNASNSGEQLSAKFCLSTEESTTQLETTAAYQYIEDPIQVVDKNELEESNDKVPNTPAPPLPPRQKPLVSRTSSTATVFQNFPADNSDSTASDTSDRLDRMVSSTSKPPLPERRPISHRSMPRAPPIPPLVFSSSTNSDHSERSRSTPPSKASIAVMSQSAGRMSRPQHESETEYESDVSHGGVKASSAPRSSADDSRRYSEGVKNTIGITSSVSNSDDTRRVGANIQPAVSYKRLTHVTGNTAENEVGRAASWAVMFDRLLSDTAGLATFTPLRGRAASWAAMFDRLLNDTAGLATFTAFLKKEFSEENIIFWTKCEEYKALTDELRKVRAHEIYDTHLRPSTASDPVNVDEESRLAVERELNGAAVCLFSPAQKHIYVLMKQDSYPRFLKSDIYKQAVIAEMEGRPFPYGVAQEQTGSAKKKSNDKKLMKKSKSSATAEDPGEEKRRRSILPWNRNKTEKKLLKAGISSESSKNIAASRENLSSEGGKTKRQLKVQLPDGKLEQITETSGTTISEALTKFGERLSPGVLFYEARLSNSLDLLDLTRDVNSLAHNAEIRLEKCVIFRVDLPLPGPALAVRAHCDWLLVDVLEPILIKHMSISFDLVVAHICGTGVILKSDTNVTTLNYKHITVQTLENVRDRTSGFGLKAQKQQSSQQLPKLEPRQKLDFSCSAAMQQLQELFADVLPSNSGKAAAAINAMKFDDLGTCRPDKVNSKSKGAEEFRTSGIFQHFMRHNSVGEKDKVKKSPRKPVPPLPPPPPSGPVTPTPDRTAPNNKDLDNKFLDLLSRAQCRQLDDQRGMTLQGIQVPDFLRTDSATNINNSCSTSTSSSCIDLRESVYCNSDQVIGSTQSLNVAASSRRYTVDLLDSGDSLNRRKSCDGGKDGAKDHEYYNYNPSGEGAGGNVLRLDEEWNGEICAEMSDEETNMVIPARRLEHIYRPSFSPTCLLPDQEEAERYFSQDRRRSVSPDYNDSRLMEGFDLDIGMSSVENPAPPSTRTEPIGSAILVDPHAQPRNVTTRVATPKRLSDSVFAIPTAPPPGRLWYRTSLGKSTDRLPIVNELVSSKSEMNISDNVESKRFKHDNPIWVSSMHDLSARSESEPLPDFKKNKRVSFTDKIVENWMQKKLKSDRLNVTLTGSDSPRSTPSPTTHDMMLIGEEAHVVSRNSKIPTSTTPNSTGNRTARRVTPIGRPGSSIPVLNLAKAQVTSSTTFMSNISIKSGAAATSRDSSNKINTTDSISTKSTINASSNTVNNTENGSTVSAVKFGEQGSSVDPPNATVIQVEDVTLVSSEQEIVADISSTSSTSSDKTCYV